MDLKKFIQNNSDRISKIYWDEVIQKYVNNLELSKILLEKLKKEEYFNNAKTIFNELNGSINRYLEDTKNPVYQIAIVGAIKAGKSTLINTLIGHDLLSVDITPETATLTKIKHSEANSLNVKFYSSIEWNNIWKNANERKATVFLEEYRTLEAESVKSIYLDKVEENFTFSSFEELKKEIARWTSSKKKEHYFVKEIEIGLSDLKLNNQIALVDTPGLNDAVEYRSDITKKYIDSANAVIICVNAKTLRSEEYNTIAGVFSRARYRANKVYVVGTQLDTLNSKEDWEKQRAEWIKHLKEETCFGSEEKAKEGLIGVSSHAYVKASKDITKDDAFELTRTNLLSKEDFMKLINENTEKCDIEEIRKKIMEASNIDKLDNILRNKLLNNYNTEIVSSFGERYTGIQDSIKKFVKEYLTQLENAKKEIEKSEVELIKKREVELERAKRIQVENRALEERINDTTSKLNMDLNNFLDEFDKLNKAVEKISI